MWHWLPSTKAARTVHEPQHIVTKTHAHQRVQDGVEAAAGVGECACDVLQQQAAEFPGQFMQQDHRVRELERQEQKHQRQHQLQGALLLPLLPPPLHLTFPQNLGDQSVAGHHYKEGQTEHANDGHPSGHLGCMTCQHAAIRIDSAPRNPREKDFRKAQDHRDGPNTQSCQRPNSKYPLPQTMHDLSARHHQVTVDTDARQQ